MPSRFAYGYRVFSGDYNHTIAVGDDNIAGVDEDAGTVDGEVIRFGNKSARSDSACAVPVRAVDGDLLDFDDLVGIACAAVGDSSDDAFFRPAEAVVGADEAALFDAAGVNDYNVSGLCGF